MKSDQSDIIIIKLILNMLNYVHSWHIFNFCNYSEIRKTFHKNFIKQKKLGSMTCYYFLSYSTFSRSESSGLSADWISLILGLRNQEVEFRKLQK
jgi:hypothetical protein